VRTRIDALGLSPSILGAQIKIASVGAATTRDLRSHFPTATVAAEPVADFRAEGLLAALEAHDLARCRVLIPASERARDTLPLALRARGAHVDVVIAYRTLPVPGLREQLAADLAVDLVAFASPSAVENFAAASGDRARGMKVAVIGPVTEATARGLGMDVVVVAVPSTAEGLAGAIARYLTRA
jgi:uroporphyrinogen-III synthase